MNYWHMQLHPDDKSEWSSLDIRKIILQKLIGCSGPPVNMFQFIEIGDYVLVRHGGEIIALTKVISKPEITPSELKNEYVWFDHYCKVDILETYESEYVYGKGWFLPKTLMPIDNDIAYDYVIDLLKKINIKMEENNLKENLKLLKYKKQIILQGPPGTGKTRKAKIIAKEILGLSSVKGLENSEQFKLVQFHPGYMYDDFVRGIVVKHDEEKEEIIYEAENKVLGQFAESANKNYIRSRVDNTISPAKSDFQRFKDYVILKLDESPENKFFISKNVYIFHVDDYRFKYKGDNWTTHSHGLNMNFSELEKIITYGFKERIEINKSSSLNSLTRSHATYFANVIDQYNSFLKSESENSYEPLNNYVLIIDEINRANLSSVLGELIYALEYRGDTVESMYEVGGSRELILPSNLYIIGTMNTADRSVGHIDYALRRRFAFVDVLPKNLKIEDGLENFDETLFLQIKSLFTKDEYQTNSDYLADEFKPAQVALGHSYFIDKTEEGGSMDIRLEYEIKPILREYVRDGILKPGALEIIENLGK